MAIFGLFYGTKGHSKYDVLDILIQIPRVTAIYRGYQQQIIRTICITSKGTPSNLELE